MVVMSGCFIEDYFKDKTDLNLIVLELLHLP